MRVGKWMTKNTGIGLLVSLAICCVLQMIGALLLMKEILPATAGFGWTVAVWAHASFFGSRVAIKNRTPRLLHGSLQGIWLLLLIILASICIWGFAFLSRIHWGLVGSILGGSIIAAVLPEVKNRKSKRKRITRKRSH